ncbi:MAG: hypothetical protein OEY07_19040, partial [Gammaproteobacteria bacterium]|nr:hypothetical protein [Gammaproteobacteria bacterium]
MQRDNQQSDNSALDVYFLIQREEKIGHKDIDHYLPFFYFLEQAENLQFQAKGIIVGAKNRFIDSQDKRTHFLCSQSHVTVEYLYSNPVWIDALEYVAIKSVFWGRPARLMLKVFSPRRKSKNNELNIWKEKLGHDYLKSKSPLILALHLNSRVIPVINIFRALNKNAKWAVIPHGTSICDNAMVMASDMGLTNEIKVQNMFQYVDYFVRTSEREKDDAIAEGIDPDKVVVIGSPRFCKEWLNIKTENCLDGPMPECGKGKVKILFLIPKRHINIFTEELIRTIDFISRYDDIELILNRSSRNYPPLSDEILKRQNVHDYLISTDYSTSSLIEWADLVFHSATGILFESFMRNKITVFPRYLTSNTLISEIYDAGITLKNRDELRNLCIQATTSLTELQHQYFTRYGENNARYIEDFVSGGKGSVPNKIISVVEKIRSDFSV